MAADNKKMSSSTFLDMDAAEDNSDYEMDFDNGITRTGGLGGGSASRSTKRPRNLDDADADKEGGLRGDISKGVANYVWEESRARARKAFSIYGNIDILRPYYDVEPKEVLSRLTMSLVPRLTSSSLPQATIPRELYGPTMLVFTLIAMLLFEMKSSGHVVQEGTLMGTAIGTCFGYWLGVSGLVWLTAYVCNVNISMIQTLHILGYALFGHCLVILLTTLVHPFHNHLFFYALFLVFGGLSTLRLVVILTSRTPGRTQKLVMAALVLTLHLLFLVYLHFAYHRVVEELSGASIGGGDMALKSTGGSGMLRGGAPIAVLETTTTQAFTRLARKSFQRVLRGGGGGGDRSVVQDGVIDLSVTSSNVLIQDLVRTLNNSTVVLQQSTAKQ